MKFLLDENFPRSAFDLIEECGHKAVLFDDVCEFGAEDEIVFSEAQRLGATILTSDRDFYHTVPLIHPAHAGNVVVAFRQPNRAAIHARLSNGSWRTSTSLSPTECSFSGIFHAA